MKLPRLPILYLSIGAGAIVLIAWLVAAMVDQSATRSAYAVWLENQTFIAAIIAVAAAALAARPVYMQVKAQSVTAALDLLHRLEAESQANVDAHTKRDDITGEIAGVGYAPGGQALSVVTLVNDSGDDAIYWGCDPVVWNTATITARGAVVYKRRGGAASADELCLFLDFGEDVSSTASSFEVTPDALGLLAIA